MMSKCCKCGGENQVVRMVLADGSEVVPDLMWCACGHIWCDEDLEQNQVETHWDVIERGDIEVISGQGSFVGLVDELVESGRVEMMADSQEAAREMLAGLVAGVDRLLESSKMVLPPYGEDTEDNAMRILMHNCANYVWHVQVMEPWPTVLAYDCYSVWVSVDVIEPGDTVDRGCEKCDVQDCVRRLV